MTLFSRLKGLAPQMISSDSLQEKRETTHPILGRQRPPVRSSADLVRILQIPTRIPVDLDGLRGQALVQLMSRRLERANASCVCQSRLGRPCIRELKPAQAWALYEAPLAGGLLAPIGVGHGKTILDLLMPLVMPRCSLAVLLIPPNLREQLLREYLALREHFYVPSLIVGETGYVVPGKPVVHVIPYSRFSRQESTDILSQLRPDLVIADEAHKLRYHDTATTSRVLRYFADNPATRLCVWSGTLTSKSIKDYAHLSKIALKQSSPLPHDWGNVEEWAVAIDPSDWLAPMGALKKLCQADESLHQGFHRRLTSTLGVVSTKASSVDASLTFQERKAPPLPESLKNHLTNLRESWVRPDGEELIDALSVARVARELSCGFFYRWKFPRGEPAELIDRWFECRKAWHKELRQKLQDRREYLDSPLLCSKAAIRSLQGYDGPLPTWESLFFLPWLEVKDLVQPESEAVWVDDFLAKDAADWALKTRGIVWYEHSAFGHKVSALSNLSCHGGGQDAEQKILAETGRKSIIVSIKAHGTGRDGLQHKFDTQLVANPPCQGAVWEQLIGRLFRMQQKSDEVVTYVYRHTPEMRDAIDTALAQARYIEGTMGTKQAMLLASYNW